jgi:predicted dehydrogenase
LKKVEKENMTTSSPEGRGNDGPRQLNVALAGLGFMGTTHLKAWKQVPGVRVMAVTDADPKRRAGDLTSAGGNFGGPGEVMDFSNVRQYPTLKELLADPEIDAVDICLPTDEHGKAGLAVLRSGKHVLIEKPMATDEGEITALLDEGRRSNRILMVAQILRFSPAYVVLADALKSAGSVRSAAFRRRCAAPTWNKWLTDPARSGGGVFDLLIHDADYCISRWGMPESVRAIGYEDLPRGIDLVHAELNYAGITADAVTISGGWHLPGAYPFSMDFTVVTDKSVFEWGSAGATEFLEYGQDGKATPHKLPDSDAFAAELGYFADCVIHGRKPERCLPEESAHSVALMHRILESRKQKGALVKCTI